MFGYIKVDQANLLGKEYEAYKGVYCALCKQLGRDYSIFARFLLSYDCTFYAILALDLAEAPPCYKQGRCRFNPFKKCNYAETETKALQLAAALSVICAYYKLLDNLADSPWYQRLLCRLIQPFFSSWRKKASKNYPELDAAVARMLNEQFEAEKDESCLLDQAAAPTAQMLQKACSILPDMLPLRANLEPERTKRIIGTTGYYLGRWIYLIDAADDFEKDVRRRCFNPFSLPDIPQEGLADYMEQTLNHALSEALLSYGLLEKGRFDPIISNVLYDSCVKIQSNIIIRYRDKQTEG